MIIDTLDNTELYESINPLFKQAFDYLKTLDFSSLEAGKTILIEDKLFVMVNDTNLKTKDTAKLEIHDKYIDIQIPVSTPESFGWSARNTLQSPREAFNPEKDIQFFTDTPSTYVKLQPREFVIFFPEDGHAPCVGEGPIRKIIVKVAVN